MKMTMMMTTLLPPLLLLRLAAAGAQEAAAAASSLLPSTPSSLALPKCPDKCGNITVPYPFGIREGCYRQDSSSNQTFLMTCNYTFQPPKLFIDRSNIPVLNISSLEKVVIRSTAAAVCNDDTRSTKAYKKWDGWIILPPTSPFAFSDSQNIFTVLGCNTFAIIYNKDFARSCASYCNREEMMTMLQQQLEVNESSCSSGIGCCRATIPKGLKQFGLRIPTLAINSSDTSSFAPCGFSFLVDKDYDLRITSATDFSIPTFARKAGAFTVVLDWAVGNQTCEEAQNDSANFSCRGNSTCVGSTNGPGYRCSCLKGFDGNPYLPQGCQDINECEDQANYPCKSVGSVCINTVGNYSCYCPHGTYDDGTRCTKSFPLIKVAVGGGLSLIVVLIAGPLIYWIIKQRRLLKLREKFFRQNGGFLLQEHLGRRQGALETGKIFTARELEKATNNYNKSGIIGRGGSGTVYRGNLSDNNKAVAIKKSKAVDENQIEQFINEVFILSQINHRNVVKLLGCCLETQVPLLVYEYVTNGTLFSHIHGPFLSWNHRLRIASETAAALAYLHSAASIPIIHRDVKSANILLDENYTAKVADFGASRLIPMDQAHVTTLIFGTSGYLDPEYLLTSQLTEKSDVYSFGVVLVELLTGKKPVYFDRKEKAERNLSIYFISSMEGNHLLEIVDAQLVEDGASMVQLTAVAELAMRCLSVKGDERPTMKEVAAELDGLARASAFSSTNASNRMQMK